MLQNLFLPRGDLGHNNSLEKFSFYYLFFFIVVVLFFETRSGYYPIVGLGQLS